MHTAIGATFANASLPKNRAFAIRVKSINHARLLSRKQYLSAVREFLNEDRRPEVVVRPRTLARAGAAEHVAGRHLFRPYDSSALQIQRQNRVAHIGGGSREIVARRNVQQTALGIQRRRSPDARARWTKGSDTALLDLLRRLANGVGLPHLGSILGAQRRHAASERATWVIRIGRTSLFPGSGWDEDNSAIDRGGAG